MQSPSYRLFRRALRTGELRLLAPYDAQALLDLTDSDRSHFEAWLPWAREIKTVTDAGTFIGRGTQRFVEQATPWIGVWLGGEMVGGLLFWPIDEKGRHVELGYWLASRAGGRGVITDAVAVLVDHCFEELGLNKVVIRSAARNKPSCAVPERLGFTQEGVLREHFFNDGEPHDLVVYSMLRSAWRTPLDRTAGG